uniref:CCHC-type domain-containing protein n=1 Tax=Brassica oleracea var. oleracea TaxID=109376 RepID=A0A0D3CDB4_BRAOL
MVIVPSPKPREATVICLIETSFRLMPVWRRCCIRQFLIFSNSKRRETPTLPQHQNINQSCENHKQSSSTWCFKCHRIGHYANKCQNQKPLVTLENENVETEPEKEGLLPIFDDYAHKPMADKEQNRGHQANQEGPSSIQRPNQTQDLRTNLFEEGGNDVPQPMDQYMEPA